VAQGNGLTRGDRPPSATVPNTRPRHPCSRTLTSATATFTPRKLDNLPLTMVSAETPRAIAYGASRRVGWPRLTRGRDPEHGRIRAGQSQT
jgi:hypothetical protein